MIPSFQSSDTLPAIPEDDITWPDLDLAFERRPTRKFSRKDIDA